MDPSDSWRRGPEGPCDHGERAPRMPFSPQTKRGPVPPRVRAKIVGGQTPSSMIPVPSESGPDVPHRHTSPSLLLAQAEF
jgi:hypothetical protein